MVEPYPVPLPTHTEEGEVIRRSPLQWKVTGQFVTSNWKNSIMVVGYGLTVKPSGLPGAGNGLYVDVDVTKGQIITFYDGHPISNATAKAIKDIDTAAISHYATWKAKNQVIAGYRVPVNGVGGASFANADHRQVNAKLVMDVGQAVFLEATQDIKEGREVFIDYGAGYAIDHPEAKMKGTPARGVVTELADVREWRNRLFAIGSGINVGPVIGPDGKETGRMGAFADAWIQGGAIFTWYDKIEIGGVAGDIEESARLNSALLAQKFGEERQYARGIRLPSIGAGGGSFVRVISPEESDAGVFPNVTFEYALDPKSSSGERVVVVRSTRDIEKGEELFAETPDFAGLMSSDDDPLPPSEESDAPAKSPPPSPPPPGRNRIYFGPGAGFYGMLDELMEAWHEEDVRFFETLIEERIKERASEIYRKLPPK
jgi:hypothetical protein